METKPGYLTTEFWTTVILIVLGIVQDATGTIDVNNKWVILGQSIIGGLYAASRGLAKAGVPYTPSLTKTPPQVDIGK
jgi:hypothetical protein